MSFLQTPYSEIIIIVIIIIIIIVLSLIDGLTSARAATTQSSG